MKPRLAITYFNSFANRDLATLEMLLANDVVITDWAGECLGKEKFIGNIQSIYRKHKNILVDISNVAVGQNSMMIEIKMALDKAVFQLVYVMDYDSEDKIKSMRVYKK
jgi:hypothetical protein